MQEQVENSVKPRQWKDIVRTVLKDAGHREWQELTINGEIFVTFSDECFVIGDTHREIQIFPHFVHDEQYTLQCYVALLGKCDIHAEIVPETPQQGAYVCVPKMYDDWK